MNHSLADASSGATILARRAVEWTFLTVQTRCVGWAAPTILTIRDAWWLVLTLPKLKGSTTRVERRFVSPTAEAMGHPMSGCATFLALYVGRGGAALRFWLKADG